MTTMEIAIAGFGREGKSALKFLQRSQKYKKPKLTILDKSSRVDIPAGVSKQLGNSYLKNLERFDSIIRSPGIPYNHPALQKAREAGVTFSSTTKIFFEHCPCPIIGVTGTKGKGTTATLLWNILKKAGRDAHLLGNIGTASLDTLPKLKKNSLVVFELSSFQLQDMTQSPHSAVLLDMFPDHQDSHATLKEYYRAKSNIARYQKKKDTVFFFADNAQSRKAAKVGAGKKIAVETQTVTLLTREDVKIPGVHNFKNAVMAATVALHFGISKKIILAAVRKFRGTPHRLEYVKAVGGVDFYNDSASTNPHTTAAAIRAFGNRPLILIAGGQDKKLSYAPLALALKKSSVCHVILLGENKNKIKKAIAHCGVSIDTAPDLKSAAKKAFNTAKTLLAKSGWLTPLVVFSPGATSFDMFKNYADRGEQFKKIINSVAFDRKKKER